MRLPPAPPSFLPSPIFAPRSSAPKGHRLSLRTPFACHRLRTIRGALVHHTDDVLPPPPPARRLRLLLLLLANPPDLSRIATAIQPR
jgi:hypothetical protein